jgi:F0F1-type ATP synthase epsilon subunit
MPSKYKGNFRCVILSAKRLILEEEVNSVFITGDRGEYELLAHHYPLIGIVTGDIVINWEKHLPVKGGVVRFFANECNIMIEEKVNPVGQVPGSN